MEPFQTGQQIKCSFRINTCSLNFLSYVTGIDEQNVYLLREGIDESYYFDKINYTMNPLKNERILVSGLI